VADIVLKKAAGSVTTKIDVLGAAPAVTSTTLWILDDSQPDHFRKDRQIKAPDDPEAALYNVGADPELDGKFLEWVWTATRPAGSTVAQGTIRITLEQGGAGVDGYPLDKRFDFDDAGPVTFSLTRHIRVAA